MSKSLLLSFSLSFLLLFNTSLAFHPFGQQQRPQRQSRGQQGFNECQLDQLEALEPDRTIDAEAGQIESWDPNHEQFQCAGVAVVRRTIESNGLHLPAYSNAPQLIYIVRGRGILGLIFPGCAETFEESPDQQSQQQEGRGRREQGGRSQQQQIDRHQKIQHIREGDVIAIPAGVAFWSYNNGNNPIVAVSLFDTSNSANQLDQFPRRFYLAGNPEQPHEQQGQRGRHQQHGRGREGQRGRQQQQEGNNLYSGFDEEFLAKVFQVDVDTIRQLQGENDDRKSIVRVKGNLGVISPPRQRQGREEQGQEQEEGQGERERERREQREREEQRQHHGGRGSNGLEETICSARVKENLNDPQGADFYNPQAGRISTINSNNLPILNYLQLSAERGVLYRNAATVPHWNLNAHSLIYVTRGRARIQVVDHNGNNVFDREVEEGQLLTVPQNFAVAKQAGNEGFEYIAFKTNDKAMINTLAGRASAIRAMPEDVLANVLQISVDEARNLKYNRQENLLFPSRSQSQRRAIA